MRRLASRLAFRQALDSSTRLMTYCPVMDDLTASVDESVSVGRGGSEITVLVVDDEPSNLASLEKIFQREGMRVFTAEGAKAALDLVRKHRVQVVLTDLM